MAVPFLLQNNGLFLQKNGREDEMAVPLFIVLFDFLCSDKHRK